MIPQSFEYFRPETVSEAIALLKEHGDGAKILSGGQSLIPMMKVRLARPEYLIDINRLENLQYIKEEGGFLKIGGLTREADLETSDLIRSNYPIILDTAAMIADPQVRNLATVGGNLAHGVGELTGRIGEEWQHRAHQDPAAHSALGDGRAGVEPPLRARSARFDGSGQLGVGESDRQVQRDGRDLRGVLKQVQVS